MPTKRRKKGSEGKGQREESTKMSEGLVASKPPARRPGLTENEVEELRQAFNLFDQVRSVLLLRLLLLSVDSRHGLH